MSPDLQPESFIDQDTHAFGTLKTEGNICVQGTMEGKIISKNRVRVSKVGRIQGTIETKEAVIDGHVTGPIEASEIIRINETSRLESDIVAPSILVQPGSSIQGYFIILPDKEERDRCKKERDQKNSTTSKPITFAPSFPKAKKVQLVGDFIDWNESQAITMAPPKENNGVWKTQVQLKPGRYEYLFLVDGEPNTDPNNRQKVTNSFGGENSVITVT